MFSFTVNDKNKEEVYRCFSVLKHLSGFLIGADFFQALSL